MRKLFVLTLALFVTNIGSTLGRAQGCSGCNINNIGGENAPNQIWVDCIGSDCSSGCGTCHEFKFKNMYACKNITKIDFEAPLICDGEVYSVCQTTTYPFSGGSCHWDILYAPDQGSYAGCKVSAPCTATPSGISWSVIPNAGCLKLAQGGWVFIDYCGPIPCSKTEFTVYFDDGSSCPIDMSTYFGNCCTK